MLSRAAQRGGSMTEVLVVITVIGLMAAIGIPFITGGVQGSKETVAGSNVEQLNGAVRTYSTAVREVSEVAVSGNTDESNVLDLLKAEGTGPGSPYLNPQMVNDSVVYTSDTGLYRAFWNGVEFQLISPGASGSGIDLLKLQFQ